MNWPWLRRKPKSTGVKLPEFLPILQELALAWDALTADDLTRCERQFQPVQDGETKLGVLHSQEARRALALWRLMENKCAEAKLYATGKAQDEQESKFYAEQSSRFDALGDCLKELFWAQVKDDIGGEAWENKAIGVRAGWMIVKANRPDIPDFMRMFGGWRPE